MGWPGSKSSRSHQPGPIWLNTVRELGHLHEVMRGPGISHSGWGLAEHFPLFMGAVEVTIYSSLQGQKCSGLGCITTI